MTFATGFAYSSLTQIVFNPSSSFPFYHVALDMFWVSLLLTLSKNNSQSEKCPQISTAVCLGVSVHVILVTIYIQVYGQGLSIHGPIGEFFFFFGNVLF